MIDTPFQLFDSLSVQSSLSDETDDGQIPWAVVLADGEQPDQEIPIRLLNDAPYVVCCDSAIQRCDWADAVVGDGDSIPSWAREEYEDIFYQVDEQDDNDLTKATRFCWSKGIRRIVYLGATGRREDHTLGNISLMVRYASEFGIEPLLATNYGWFVPAHKDCTFKSFPGQQVSIFNFGCTHLRTEGLVYDGYAYRSWWQGTLNEAAAHHFRVVADGDYLVFRTYKAK